MLTSCSLLAAVLLALQMGCSGEIGDASAYGGDRAKAAEARVRPALEQEMKRRGLTWGAPVYLRIFKEESEMEMWAQDAGTKKWLLLKTWPVHYFSGSLGSKLREGDGQAPEGFYSVTKGSLNPRSSYHLSFNIGFPNAYDRANGRTGSFIMVHGSTVSVGCFAMTDSLIEEIYTLVDSALRHGRKTVRVDVFPFRMTAERMERVGDSEWLEFWKSLKPGYDLFERERVPPSITVFQKSYVIRSGS